MLLVRARHEEAVAALRTADADGVVGPTAASGWTCVGLDHDVDDAVRLGFSTYFCVEETRSGLNLELKSDTGAQRLTWSQVSNTSQRDALANGLVDQFGPAHALDQLRALLAEDDLDAESFWQALEAVLELPEVAAPEPDRCVVVTRGDPEMVRLAAAIAGPTWILSVDSGWTITIPAHDESPTEALAAAVSGAMKRRDRTVLLWSHGDAFGLQIWRRGSVDVSWSWGSGWETVVSDPLAFETAVSEAIIPINPDLHVPTLRSLLRRQRLDELAVTSLLELLGMPSTVAEALGASQTPEEVPRAELVQRATPRQATVTALRSAWVDRRQSRSRPLYLIYAVGTAVAAFVCLVMTCLGIAVLVTDGSVVDQTAVTTEDQVFVGVFAILTVVLTPTAVYRLRKARQS